MNEITILCWICSTPIFTTDAERLDWPLRGEMFSPLYPNFVLRPGPLNLEIFCVSCKQFPLHYDPYTPGGNAVGKSLKIKGPNGKPLVTTIKQILLNATGLPMADQGGAAPPHPVPDPDEESVASGAGASRTPAPEWPCPECGAKKRFHRKGCSIHENTKPETADTQPANPNEKMVVCPGCEQLVSSQGDGRHDPLCPVRKGYRPLIPEGPLKNRAEEILGSAAIGPDTAEAPIRPEEVAALEQDRARAQAGNAPRTELKRTVIEAIARGETPKSPYLRPGEMFVPKN